MREGWKNTCILESTLTISTVSSTSKVSPICCTVIVSTFCNSFLEMVAFTVADGAHLAKHSDTISVSNLARTLFSLNIHSFYTQI